LLIRQIVIDANLNLFSKQGVLQQNPMLIPLQSEGFFSRDFLVKYSYSPIR